MSSQSQDTQGSGARDEGLVRYLTEEFLKDYQQGRLSRREALKRVAGVVGSVVLAESLIAACAPLPRPTPHPAEPAKAPPTSPATAVALHDPATQASMIEYPGRDATLMGYLARPAGPGRSPVVLVCHENRGLNEHIEDVARRFARQGYVALAVDLLSREGGRSKIADASQVPGLLGNMPREQLVNDFYDALRYLQGQDYADTQRVGMTGFCFGGGVTWRCATQIPELKAAVPFYGASPPLEEVPNIQAAVLAIYGESDQRITSGAAAIEKALRENNKIFEIVIYPNAGHAFFNDTGERYNPEAAKDAWGKTLAWLERYLAT